MKLFSLLCAVAILHVASPAAPAQTGWQRWSANGHYYLAVHSPGGVNWADARQQAQSLGGDLATITSAPENDFVFSLVDNPIYWRTLPTPLRIFGPWLGGFQPAGSGEPLGSWSWVTGEAWGYANWSPSEPNNYMQLEEDHLHFFANGTTIPGRQWNDLDEAALLFGFVVETVTPSPISYCTGGTSSSGCVASIVASGQPSASYSTGCTIHVQQVEGQKTGIIFYGLNAGIANPWGSSSSVLCVKPPIQRTFVQSTGGSLLACNGSMTLNWNTYQQSHAGALGHPWSVGTDVRVQGWYRDPFGPPPTTALSSALQLVVQP